MTPPPLPPPSIEFMRFEGSGAGLHTVAFDRRRIEQAQVAARQWLASQQNIEVISIETCFGNMTAFVTVWFLRKVA
jgi:hypothetical protein